MDVRRKDSILCLWNIKVFKKQHFSENFNGEELKYHFQNDEASDFHFLCTVKFQVHISGFLNTNGCGKLKKSIVL